ncbi:hypothetical protein SPRG_18356, partial [Saprolegnia parasitica CBS 223.65]
MDAYHGACYSALLLLLLVALIEATVPDVLLHSMWSATTTATTALTTPGIWVDVPGASIPAFLALPMTLLVTYSATVYPTSAQPPVAIIDKTRPPGADDLISFRLLVDGSPMRASGGLVG